MMLIPKFAYNAGSGVVDLIPTIPPLKKTYSIGGLKATRHDSITSSGEKQSVTERIDTIFPLDFPYVPVTDMAAWEAFMSYALTGGYFTFFPDSTNEAVYYEYTLDSMDWTPKFANFGYFSFSFEMRLYVGPNLKYNS
jgi:hypothetical protein